MPRLESLDGSNWSEFWSSPRALLMLGKTDCPACQAWTEELEGKLSDGASPDGVRFGKLLLDQPGLGSFKKTHGEILRSASDLPLNLLLVDGAVVKQWFGGGWDRFENRLRRTLDPS